MSAKLRNQILLIESRLYNTQWDGDGDGEGDWEGEGAEMEDSDGDGDGDRDGDGDGDGVATTIPLVLAEASLPDRAVFSSRINKG